MLRHNKSLNTIPETITFLTLAWAFLFERPELCLAQRFLSIQLISFYLINRDFEREQCLVSFNYTSCLWCWQFTVEMTASNRCWIKSSNCNRPIVPFGMCNRWLAKDSSSLHSDRSTHSSTQQLTHLSRIKQLSSRNMNQCLTVINTRCIFRQRYQRY